MAEHENTNKNLMGRCTSRIKTWAKGVLEENERTHFFRAVTMKKSKKGRNNRVKCGVTMPKDPQDISDVDKANGNDNQKKVFSLECGKLNEMKTFREMTES